MMKVTLKFLFANITDPNSAEADEIVSELTELTTEWNDQSHNCYAFVEDAVCVEGDK